MGKYNPLKAEIDAMNLKEYFPLIQPKQQNEPK